MSDSPPGGRRAESNDETLLTTNGREESIDELLRVLADHERRVVCYYLEREGTLTVDEVARLVAATKSDGHPDAADLTATGVSLRHVHLPTLDDAGIVHYDPEEETVRLAENAPIVTELLATTSVELR